MLNFDFWKGRTILITGGTGSFGKAFLMNVLLSIDFLREVRVFSRDEKKQDDLRREFGHRKIKFIVGDVRDREAVDKAMAGVDYVFHAAALKHVSTGENHPLETVKTNILGSNNVIESAIEHHVKKVVVLSTDKAVEPTCAMGMTKGLMEKCALARCHDSDTAICVTRFGNVMGSRNSVIPIFASLLGRKEKVTITDPGMIRYMMTMTQAQELVQFAFEKGCTGSIFVLNSPQATVQTVFEAVKDIVAPELPDDHFVISGATRGEKMAEKLLTDEEKNAARVFETSFGQVLEIPFNHVFGKRLDETAWIENALLNRKQLGILLLNHDIISEVE